MFVEEGRGGGGGGGGESVVDLIYLLSMIQAIITLHFKKVVKAASLRKKR